MFALPGGQALVQTIDFFTPVVDDPYSYGQIAAANALSDVYAMGGKPLTVMNVACFNPLAAPPEVWSSVLKGMYDKTVEAGAVVLGGHSVEDTEPKFGMSVTGIEGSATAIALARSELGLRFPIHHGPVEAMPFDDREYDGVFCYGLARIVSEHFREPDAQLGFLAGGLTMGMLLSIPMLIVGGIAIVCALRAEPRNA